MTDEISAGPSEVYLNLSRGEVHRLNWLLNRALNTLEPEKWTKFDREMEEYCSKWVKENPWTPSPSTP